MDPGGPDGRDDLAAMTTRLSRALAEAELPVLRAHELSMWGYVVLVALGRSPEQSPVRTQAALAQAIRADKTRLIAVLDELQERGLIERRPDPTDRRAHLLSLTAEGRRVRRSAQAGIRRREERLLARLPASDRDGFLRALRLLSGLPIEDLAGTGDLPVE